MTLFFILWRVDGTEVVTKQVTGPPFAYADWLAAAQRLDLLSYFPESGQPGTLYSYGRKQTKG